MPSPAGITYPIDAGNARIYVGWMTTPLDSVENLDGQVAPHCTKFGKFKKTFFSESHSRKEEKNSDMPDSTKMILTSTRSSEVMLDSFMMVINLQVGSNWIQPQQEETGAGEP